MGLFDAQVTNATTTGTSSSAPWAGVAPYLTFGFDQARQIYDTGGTQYYPHPTYTPFSPQTEQALKLTEGRALSGSPLNFGARDMLTNTLQGDYLNSNPYLDQTFDKAADRVTRNISGVFSKGGRYGSGIHQDILGENLSDLATNIYGGNYQQERGRQMQASALAPTIANTDYYDINQLGNVGGIVEAKADEQLQDQINRYDFQQNAPERNLENYMRFISGNFGGETTTSETVPQFSNSPFQNALGLGLTGASLADSFGYDPIIGGSIGGLLGLFS